MRSLKIYPAVKVLLVLLGLVSAACGQGLYRLGDPPAREEWRRHSLSPTEDETVSREHFLAAKDSILSFVEAMSSGRHDEAYTFLSNETRILLDDVSPSGRGETILSEGIVQRDGAEYTVDPLDLFVIRGLQDIVDTYQDRLEAETYRRKEVYAISEEGDVHHLVLIYEQDRWRIHKPEIELTPGAPGRRTTSD